MIISIDLNILEILYAFGNRRYIYVIIKINTITK